MGTSEVQPVQMGYLGCAPFCFNHKIIFCIFLALKFLVAQSAGNCMF